MPNQAMRFGLAGTGPWAHLAHGPGLLAADRVDLVGVWGRDPAKTRALAGELKVEPYDDYAALLSDVDAVAFALPPGVQAALALEAAAVGKHLLLDKPIAGSVEDARALAAEAESEGIASVVFFTDRFAPEMRDWVAEAGATGGWRGGWVRLLAALDEPGNPFGDSPWRRERGGLWDVGPHALSNLTSVLGPITGLTATGGAGDLVHLVVTHESGATSTASLSLFAPPAGRNAEFGVWGEGGVRLSPERTTPAVESLTLAANELVACAEAGESHPVDVTFGAHVVELIVAAELSLQHGRERVLVQDGE